MHTEERILGIPESLLAKGEAASFTSHDGERMSARLYLPAKELGFKGPRPLVYYIHGGPQSQERPNFAWFSMPLIQFLTLRGFAVFVPNARGSTGYGPHPQGVELLASAYGELAVPAVSETPDTASSRGS